MKIQELFDSPVMRLPLDRDDEDLEQYLAKIFGSYLNTIKALDARDHLCARIQAAESEISQLGDWIQTAVRRYLGGSPGAAYTEILKGINFVYPRLRELQSLDIDSKDVGRLYRVADAKAKPANRERLFHAPFHLRHKVGQHRYGIPGFPCLYLGGSLELCLAECRIDSSVVPGVAIAEFAFRKTVKILDFGYRPAVLADQAGRLSKKVAGSNAPLEKFIIDYAVSWPLIAAASIGVLHDGDPFVPEYIVPQMILQWIMSSNECEGLRYFSTRFRPPSLRAELNYVFPAKHGGGPQTGYSQELKDAFELTEPIIWGPTTSGNLSQDAKDREQALNAMTKAPIS